MGQEEKVINDVLLRIPFAKFGLVTVSLPSLSLLYCFLSAYLLDAEGINDTDCNIVFQLMQKITMISKIWDLIKLDGKKGPVTNTIPSVSAVTGIKPQAYVWRICIGLHSAPRFLVGVMYYYYYKQFETNISPAYRGLYGKLLHLVFWLYNIECSCLLAVSCISNKENYPIHEKIFVVFMTSSIAHMVFGLIAFKWSRHKGMNEMEKKSYFWKKVMLLWISLSTVALLYFFVQHRVYCKPGAFSWFSAFEYMIAYANIGYHLTGLYDFKGKSLLGANLLDSSSNGTATRHIRNGRRKAE